MHNQNSSNDTVGLVPFTRRPLHEEDIQATKGDESVTDKCQLDLTKIRFHYNRGELEAGGEELAKQLSGSKWGTGKMARFCSTDDSFIMVAGLADRNAKKNAQEKKVKSDTAAAKKAAAPAKKAAVAAEAALGPIRPVRPAVVSHRGKNLHAARRHDSLDAVILLDRHWHAVQRSP